jgi:hypothetical protein
MKTLIGLLLTVVTLMVGCAPGYSGKKAAYSVEAPAYRETGMWHQNPESDSERDSRIWREESGR